MLFPAIIVHARDLATRDKVFFVWGNTVVRSMHTIAVVIFLVHQQFCLQITRSPKRHLIEKFPAYCSDESFHKRVREWYIGETLYLRHLENSEIGVPLAK